MNWMVSTLVWQLIITFVFICIVYIIWRIKHPGQKW
jgi:hypothetical protein